jgi:hypothetical protein
MPRDDILASAISQDEAVEQANAFCDDGPPPPGDPGWAPCDDYGYDWDYGEPYTPNLRWVVNLDLRTWELNGHVRARVRVMDMRSSDDFNEFQIERANCEPMYAQNCSGETYLAQIAAAREEDARRQARARARDDELQSQYGREERERKARMKQRERDVQVRREQQAGPPPRREDEAYQHALGDAHFRSDRACWYRAFTGKALEGSLAEQNLQFDAIARRFRAYSDGRTSTFTVSAEVFAEHDRFRRVCAERGLPPPRIAQSAFD